MNCSYDKRLPNLPNLQGITECLWDCKASEEFLPVWVRSSPSFVASARLRAIALSDESYEVI